MKANWYKYGLGSWLFWVACSNPVPFQPMDPGLLKGEPAMGFVEAICEIVPREAATPGMKRAATYVVDTLKSEGIKAAVQPFDDITPSGTQTFYNAWARIPGTNNKDGRFILLGSHLDTKAGIEELFVGANDSGSSSGLLMELARVLQQHYQGDVDILCYWFDGEECMHHYGPIDGLHGSRYVARGLVASGAVHKVQSVIIIDMIGDKDLTVTIPRNSTASLTKKAFNAASDIGKRSHFELFPYFIGDDHVPFLDRGIPSIVLIDFYYGSEPGRNNYWHTPEDTLDKLSEQSLETVGQVVIGMINQLNEASLRETR